MKRDGILINVHDLPAPHVIEVHSAEAIIKAGWVTDRMDFEDERSAFNALVRVVSEGDFLLEDERDFCFNIYADGLRELQAWLAEWWESSVLLDKTIQRIEDILRQFDQAANVVLKVPARMTKLRAA